MCRLVWIHPAIHNPCLQSGNYMIDLLLSEKMLLKAGFNGFTKNLAVLFHAPAMKESGPVGYTVVIHDEFPNMVNA